MSDEKSIFDSFQEMITGEPSVKPTMEAPSEKVQLQPMIPPEPSVNKSVRKTPVKKTGKKPRGRQRKIWWKSKNCRRKILLLWLNQKRK